MKVEEDVYQLIISGPKVEDIGKYTIEIAGISCTAYLNVDGKNLNVKLSLIHIYQLYKNIKFNHSHMPYLACCFLFMVL